MPIPVPCPVCGARLSVPDTVAGKSVKCPKCLAAILVPAADPGFEVVDETPMARPVMARPVAAAPARPVAAAPARSRPIDDDEDRPRRRFRDEDEEEDDDDRPRRRPTRKRPKKKASGLPIVPLIAAGGIGLLILIGGTVAYLMFGRDTGKSTSGPQALAGRPSGGTNAIAPSPPVSVPAGWNTFRTPGANLSVSVPAMLQPFNVPGQMRKPGVTVGLWQALHNNKVYQVSLVTVTKGTPPRGPIPDRDLDKMCDGFVSSANFGQERSRTHVNVGGHNGRQIEIAGAKSAVIRITAVGRHAYVLTVVSEGGGLSASDPDVKAFLESAQISG